MKKLVFGLIATVLFAFNGNAQKITQEDVRLQLAKGMIDFKTSLKPAYDKTKSVEDFKKMITGTWYSKITPEGNAVLDAAYKLLAKKSTNEEILKSYSGKEMAAAALYLDTLSKNGVKTNGSELFGGTTGDYNPYSYTISSKCAWYQFGCWLKEIFGPEGDLILHEIIVLVVNIIKNL